jgi:hypothetical protein
MREEKCEMRIPLLFPLLDETAFLKGEHKKSMEIFYLLIP